MAFLSAALPLLRFPGTPITCRLSHVSLTMVPAATSSTPSGAQQGLKESVLMTSTG